MLLGGIMGGLRVWKKKEAGRIVKVKVDVQAVWSVVSHMLSQFTHYQKIKISVFSPQPGIVGTNGFQIWKALIHRFPAIYEATRDFPRFRGNIGL